MTLPREPGKLPAALDAEWGSKFDEFAVHYKLGKEAALQPEYVGTLTTSPVSPFPTAVPWAMLARTMPTGKSEESQLLLAKQDLEVARQTVLNWFAHGVREVPSKLPGVGEKVKETTPERIAAYKKKLRHLEEIESYGMPSFDRDVWKENYRTLKMEIAVLRTELLRDLDKPFNNAMTLARFRLSKTQRDLGPIPESEQPANTLDLIDRITAWGLTIVGACLLVGLRTRLACLACAAFLLFFYLAMPALPWVPDNPRAEGHYVFVNKNIIEMLALLALATTPSGHWLGLDALLTYLNPFRRQT